MTHAPASCKSQSAGDWDWVRVREASSDKRKNWHDWGKRVSRLSSVNTGIIRTRNRVGNDVVSGTMSKRPYNTRTGDDRIPRLMPQ